MRQVKGRSKCLDISITKRDNQNNCTLNQEFNIETKLIIFFYENKKNEHREEGEKKSQIKMMTNIRCEIL